MSDLNVTFKIDDGHKPTTKSGAVAPGTRARGAVNAILGLKATKALDTGKTILQWREPDVHSGLALPGYAMLDRDCTLACRLTSGADAPTLGLANIFNETVALDKLAEYCAAAHSAPFDFWTAMVESIDVYIASTKGS